ncbi:MAG: adenosine kinase [Gammaproteobacteria bacterium]|nr:adenosine kinase [Gammaproteobacteria bacterium]
MPENPNNSDYHIYGIGAALVDTEIEVTDTDLSRLEIEKGVMTLVDPERQQQLVEHLSDHLVASKRASGGSAANTIIAASYFGARTFYSCKVAADENGDFYLRDLEAAGVDYHREIDRTDGTTGKCLVMITPDAERTMNTFLGVSETISVQELHPEAVSNSRFVYIEGYLVTSTSGRAAAIELHKMAQRDNINIALSLSDPAMVEFFRDGLTEMIGSGVDLLFCNQAEAQGFTRTDNLDDAVAELRKIARTFAITRGAQGALVFDGEKCIDIAPHAVTAIDTNGAGDMFAGAFIYALTHNLSYQQAGQLASRASAQVVSQFGPRLRPDQHQQILREVLG